MCVSGAFSSALPSDQTAGLADDAPFSQIEQDRLFPLEQKWRHSFDKLVIKNILNGWATVDPRK